MDTGDYRATACLPGVLARAAQQYEPVADAMPGAGRPEMWDYEGPTFRPWDEINRITNLMEELTLFRPYKAGLVGTSLGGMLIPFVMAQSNLIVRQRLRIVIVDAPGGAETIINPMARWASLARLASPITRYIDVPVTDEMLPRTDQTTTSLEPRLLQQIARRNLEGHKLSMLVGQTAWMRRVGRDGSLAQACRSLLDHDVTYVVCAPEWNSAVHQPSALTWWQNHVPSMKVVWLKATHGGFLQNTPEFADLFRIVFSEST